MELIYYLIFPTLAPYRGTVEAAWWLRAFWVLVLAGPPVYMVFFWFFRLRLINRNCRRSLRRLKMARHWEEFVHGQLGTSRVLQLWDRLGLALSGTIARFGKSIKAFRSPANMRKRIKGALQVPSMWISRLWRRVARLGYLNKVSRGAARLLKGIKSAVLIPSRWIGRHLLPDESHQQVWDLFIELQENTQDGTRLERIFENRRFLSDDQLLKPRINIYLPTIVANLLSLAATVFFAVLAVAFLWDHRPDLIEFYNSYVRQENLSGDSASREQIFGLMPEKVRTDCLVDRYPDFRNALEKEHCFPLPERMIRPQDRIEERQASPEGFEGQTASSATQDACNACKVIELLNKSSLFSKAASHEEREPRCLSNAPPEPAEAAVLQQSPEEEDPTVAEGGAKAGEEPAEAKPKEGSRQSQAVKPRADFNDPIEEQRTKKAWSRAMLAECFSEQLQSRLHYPFSALIWGIVWTGVLRFLWYWWRVRFANKCELIRSKADNVYFLFASRPLNQRISRGDWSDAGC